MHILNSLYCKHFLVRIKEFKRVFKKGLMLYSKTCEYAIRALAYLAHSTKAPYTMISEISRKTGVPHSYLAKILQELVRKKILISLRGPSGGFCLNRSASTITLFDILSAVDDLSRLNYCMMGLDQCSSTNACPLHLIWMDAKEKIMLQLQHETLETLTKKLKKVRFRRLKRSCLNTGFKFESCQLKEHAA